MSDETPRTMWQMTKDEYDQVNRVIREVWPIPEMLAAGKYLEVMAIWPPIEQRLTDALRMVGFPERLLTNDGIYKVNLLKAWVQAQWKLAPGGVTTPQLDATLLQLPRQGATPSA